MTSRASTWRLISSTPSRAWSIFLSPSQRKGMVTMPTVRISISLAMRAMVGAAPVPVPPPIPAVMNTIFVPSFSMSFTSSMLSSVASLALFGRLPAPSPSCPSWSLTGTGDSSSALRSVLHTTKATSCMPSRYMWFTALPPPPPTPMTLIILGESVAKPKSLMISSIIYLAFSYYILSSSNNSLVSVSILDLNQLGLFFFACSFFRLSSSFLRFSSSFFLFSSSSRLRRFSSS